jgi:hypothetical protein
LKSRFTTDNKQPYVDGEGNPVPVSEVLVKGAADYMPYPVYGCLVRRCQVWSELEACPGLTDGIPDSINGCAFADEDDEDVPAQPVRRSAPQPQVVDDEELDDEEVFTAPAPKAKQSVLAAVAAPAPVPAPAPAPSMDEERTTLSRFPVPEEGYDRRGL